MTSLRKFAERFDDEVKFFKGWVTRPRAVGSIVPTSGTTARRMASIVDPNSNLPVLELGPGTGVITRAILERGVKPENLFCIEYSPEFVAHLKRQFPGVNVIHGDAFNLDDTLGALRGATFDSVVSGVPLLNFPTEQRVRYVEGVLARIPEGRPMVQLTYGPRSPIPPEGGDYRVTRFDFILRNIPPTTLWLYSKGAPVLPIGTRKPVGRTLQ
jgi:phosphatidylethanolamine/phosphatidyl-N-methylethanolamine N-methyltransferase